MVPVREDLPFFFPTEKLTVPEEVPLAPEVIVIQLALDFAVHTHPVVAVTVTVRVAPAGGIETSSGAAETLPVWKFPVML